MARAKTTPASPAGRRDALRQALIDAAERRIAADGLAALRARDLAADAGCALGAIYLVFPDLGALAGAVRERTLARLEAEAAKAASPAGSGGPHARAAAVEALQALAALYLRFARDNGNLWRALFDLRAAQGEEDARALASIFASIESQLRVLAPEAPDGQRRLYAHALFAAVHGVVALGLDEERWGLSGEELAWQIEAIVAAAAMGFRRETEQGGPRAGRRGS
jgi:AcrR family transcriptional regulator